MEEEVAIMAMMKSEGVIYSELISPPPRSLTKMDTEEKKKGQTLKLGAF